MKNLLTIADIPMSDGKRLSMLDLRRLRNALGNTSDELEPEYILLVKDDENEKV